MAVAPQLFRTPLLIGDAPPVAGYVPISFIQVAEMHRLGHWSLASAPDRQPSIILELIRLVAAWHTMEVDVLIAGAGPAGSSAALVLARSCRSVLLCDDGQPRNKAAGSIHGLLTHEGQSPAEFREASRSALVRYEPRLKRIDEPIVDLRLKAGSFAFGTKSGFEGRARRVLLATGLKDELPPIPGIEGFYGSSVHHCLYCDGYEYRGKPLAAYGSGKKGAELALVMLQWSKDVVLCTAGSSVPPPHEEELAARQIRVRCEPVKALEGMDARLERIAFQRGPAEVCAALFFATNCVQRSDLYRQLGCGCDEKGGVKVDDNGETSVKGAFVAGDASRDVLQIAVALGEGARAGVAINKSLLREDGLCS